MPIKPSANLRCALQEIEIELERRRAMIVHPDFPYHWKNRALINRLKDRAAPMCLIPLWGHRQRQRTAYFEMTDEQLKMICDFQGEGSALREAMKTCGFIVQNPDEPTDFTVHQWEQHNASLMNSWVNGQKDGRRKEPTGYPRVTQTNPPKSNSNSLRVQNKNKVGNPRVFDQPEISSEQKAANHQKFAAQLKELSAKLKAGNSEEIKNGE